MASRHDIINITFQANAGKANVALKTLQDEARKSSDRVKDLKRQLDDGLRANLPADQIQKIRDDIKLAEKETKQWSSAYKDLTKGVRTLDDAIKAFNAGTLGQMSAAFNKAAANAAKLAQTKMSAGTQEWKEMDALIVEAQSNVLKATADINGLVAAIKKGGASTKSTLTQAKSDLEQLLTLEVRGSKEWKTYDAQLKVVTGELNKLAEAERKAAQADQVTAMNKRMRSLKTESASGLAELKRFWQTMVAGEEQGSAELAKYEANLKKVIAQERQRTVASAEQTLVSPQKFGIDQVRAAVQEMTKLRDGLQQGIPLWNKYNNLVKQGETYLAEYAEKEKITRGEALSLSDALKVASTAGGKGFSGTATQLQQAEAALQKAAAAAKKGSPEWIKYQEALAKVRVEMQNAGMTSERMREIIDKPTSAKNLNELSAAVKRARAELDLMAGTVGKNSKEYATLANKTKEAEIQLKTLQGQAKGTATAFDKAWSRLKTYIGLYVGAAVAMQKLAAGMSDLMELSDKMGEVRKTTGFTADEVGRLSDSLKKLDTRTSINGLLDLSVAAGQLGLKTQEDVEGFTIAANKLMVALPEMGKEGATEMLKVALATGEIDKIRRQMEEGLIEGSSATAVAMEKVGSTIDRLRATSAATAPAITDFVKRVGAVGAQSGITIDQVAALGSTVDALGMRVEMSATALSRMIPAIKNNAFDIAKAIGVTPDTLRNLFETGRGMEAILMIFQHIKDAGMDDESIEQMLGMGNMKEIMKELNQQGARAGIVFAGLSQNVDELRRQLGVAGEAYEQNIAIQQEYDKMNETTAAKWERLKNQLEEMFVGDKAQRFLGGIIDGLRTIVDIVANAYNSWMFYLAMMTGAFKAGLGQALFVQLPKAFKSLTAVSGSFFKTALAGLGALAHSMGIVTRQTRMARVEWHKLDMATKQNIWGAVIAGVSLLVFKLIEWRKATIDAMKEQGKLAAEVMKSEQAVENNFKAVDKAAVSVENANKKLKEAQDALEKAKKAMDGSKESADRLTKAEDNLKKAEDDVRMANDAHRASIEQINKLYGSYLGFMLSEISSAAELANARELINAKLRETITLKRKEAALGRLEENVGEDRDQAYGALSQSLQGAVRKQVNVGGGKKVWQTDDKATESLLRQITKVAQDEALSRTEAAARIDKLLIDAGKGGEQWKAWRANIRNRALDYQKEYKNVQTKVRDVETQFDVEMQVDREESQKKLSKQYKAADKNYADLEKKHANAQGEAKKQAAANLLKQMDSMEEMIGSAKNYYDLTNAEEKKSYEQFVNDTQTRLDGMKEQRDALLKEAGNYYKARKTVGGGTTQGGGGGGLWGSKPDATSTDYSTWDVDELVARRNQMDKFKNVLKPDTDIRAVLAEDKALMKALNNGLKNDWKSVLGWYNEERKKIQEELKTERFSTNEGHWRDEKQGRGRRNRFRESDYALAELDRYYSKRKEALEKARIDENMSEELFNRQAELLEQEHLERRSKLRDTFTAGNTKEEKEMVKRFREWWDKLQKEGKLDEVPWATVESEWAKALASDIGRNNLRAQQDMTKMEEITVKHLNNIAKIIEKERPYDGIVANLRKNLTDMDILLADIQKQGPAEDTSLLMKEQTARLQFLLGEAEAAYQTSIDDVLKRMADAGMTAWADEIRKSDTMKNALMAQLQTAYDAIQEAIKKEASQIKKQADIWWNDLIPGQDQSRKGMFEKALSQLGLQEDQVKRANSLIGAGHASERVADKLAIKQMQIRLQMQKVYYDKMRQMWDDRIRSLREQGKEIDAQHAEISKQLSLSEEQKKVDEQRVAIANQLEESQNRLYQQLKEWGDLIASSVQGVFEASAAGNREYYNELAKMNLTGKGGPGAGTYMVIENEGTDEARAHYEYLGQREALERQHEIERQNAQADAWKKVMDDINMKMSDMITDQINAMMQNQAVDNNTTALDANTAALYALAAALGVGAGEDFARNEEGFAVDAAGKILSPVAPAEPAEKQEQNAGLPGWGWPTTEEEKENMKAWDQELLDSHAEYSITKMQEVGDAVQDLPSAVTSPFATSEVELEKKKELIKADADAQKEASKEVTQTVVDNNQQQQQNTEQNDKKELASGQSLYAKLTQAANLYGAAYQAMSNDNLDSSQKFQMIALQAAGNAAMAALTANYAEQGGVVEGTLPAILAKCLGISPIYGAIIFAGLTALLGGMMGMAASKVAKSKAEIQKVTGASASAGRLATGMMTYAEGNVNELTDPSTLTPGRQYNVDGADGHTYRARYMGDKPRTHITSGPEFHLVGEKGQEAIIDAHTTRNIRLNEPQIWQDIQTLYNGGRLSATRRRTGRGVRTFAEGNLDDFEEVDSVLDDGTEAGLGTEQMQQLQASLDRNSDVLERAVTEGIHARFDVYGKGGLIDSYDTGKKNVTSHGERY